MAVTPELASAFANACMSLHFNEKEISVSIHFNKIVDYYIIKVGVPPTFAAWEELRTFITFGIDTARSRAKDKGMEKVPMSVRLVGGGVPTWLCIKIYTAVVYQCDSVFFVGDAVIKL